MPTNPNMVAIQTVTVGSGGAASITFSSIPQTYTDLMVVVSARCDETAITFGQLYVAPNNATTNLSSRLLYGYGSGTGSASYTTYDSIWTYIASNGATSNTFGNASFYFPNYTSSNNKSISVDGVNENNATDARQGLSAGLWSSSSAITSLVFYVLGNAGASKNFVQYSTATLYGVTSAGYGAKATGGIISQDANYYYHTFLASGTFTPTQSLSCDYLVVGGGGGGGYYAGAGGGGGGLRSATGQSLTAQAYTVTVGAGGASTPSSNGSAQNNGSSGSNSVFNSMTSAGGGGGAGGLNAQNGLSGGSGGGGGGYNSSGNGGAGNTPSTTPSQGNNGANGFQSGGVGNGGGGGGAGGAGSLTTGGTGSNSFSTWASATGTGVSGYYAGGGAGYPAGAGGFGGGGNYTLAGVANTGGGAGGDANSGAGGSGIVIVRYAK